MQQYLKVEFTNKKTVINTINLLISLFLNVRNLILYFYYCNSKLDKNNFIQY